MKAMPKHLSSLKRKSDASSTDSEKPLGKLMKAMQVALKPIPSKARGSGVSLVLAGPGAYIRRVSVWCDAYEDLVVPRQDLVQSLQLLDMNVYNNNFVGEQNGQGKPGAGVKVDRVTPMGYLKDSKTALDEILAFQ